MLLAQTAVRKHLDGASELLLNRSECSREDEVELHATDCFYNDSGVLKLGTFCLTCSLINMKIILFSPL